MGKTFAERRKEAIDLGQSLTEKIKADGVDAPQKKQFMSQLVEVNDTLEQINTEEAFAKSQAAHAQGLEKAGAGQPGNQNRDEEKRAKSLGDHFIKSVGGPDGLQRLKESGVKSTVTPWFEKAAGDTLTTGGQGGATAGEESPFAPWLTDVDREVVRGYRRRTVIADLLGSGNISGSIVKYFIEGPIEGGPRTTAENAQKPQFSMGNPTAESDPTKKIAGWFKMTDEMLEDLEFVASEINNRGLYELALEEERQLLDGDGEGENLLGLRNRSGVQALEAAEAGAKGASEAIFAAGTRIQIATGMMPDALIINPLDYEQLVLQTDGNGQYFAGGPFSGQYGNGGVQQNPPIWGRNTVVTPAVAVGKPLVGALRRAATIYRKGGVRVEVTNSHADDFIHNRVTTRIEERLALAVRRPSAIAEVSIDSGVPVPTP